MSEINDVQLLISKIRDENHDMIKYLNNIDFANKLTGRLKDGMEQLKK